VAAAFVRPLTTSFTRWMQCPPVSPHATTPVLKAGRFCATVECNHADTDTGGATRSVSMSNGSDDITPETEQPSGPITVTAGGLPNDPAVPDIYADGANIQVNLSGVNIIFTRSMHDPPTPVPVTVVRISASQALILTQVLRQVLTMYQQQIGPIAIPDALLEILHIGREL